MRRDLRCINTTLCVIAVYRAKIKFQNKIKMFSEFNMKVKR